MLHRCSWWTKRETRRNGDVSSMEQRKGVESVYHEGDVLQY